MLLMLVIIFLLIIILFNLRKFLKLKKINIKRKIITNFKSITLQVSYYLSTFLIQNHSLSNLKRQINLNLKVLLLLVMMRQ